VPVRGGAREQLDDQAFERLGQPGRERARRDQRILEDRAHERRQRAGHEGRPAGDRLVEGGAERVEVDARIVDAGERLR
jgi:hypothetical protein